MTDEPDLIVHARQSAEDALAAHEKTSFGPDHEAAAESWWQQTRILTLLRDLSHYADAHGVDFHAVLRDARSWYNHELAERVRYTVGDPVKIRDTFHQGIVTSVTEHEGRTSYEVRVIGKTERRLLSAADLNKASAFPGVRADSTITDPVTAETAFRRSISQAITYPEKSTALCRTLAEALSVWSGVPKDELYLSTYRELVRSRAVPAQADENHPASVKEALYDDGFAASHPQAPETQRPQKGPRR